MTLTESAASVEPESQSTTGAVAQIDELGVRRRRLQIALGVLWLLDAALQFQPYMFTRSFVTQTLAPMTNGNPALVSDPMRWAFHLIAAYPIATNAMFASIQLLIAVGLFWRRSAKVALAVSFLWAVGVWWFGEGLGGALSASSPFVGAPGAVILYALAAFVLWPSRRSPQENSVATNGALRSNGARAAWLVLWGALAYLVARPPNSASGSLRDVATNASANQPSWLAHLEHGLAGTLASSGTGIAIATALLCELVAISILFPRFLRAGLITGCVVAAFVWVIEGFGGVLTGTGTDPNSAPLLVLLAAAFWPSAGVAHGADTPAQGASRGLALAGAWGHRIATRVALSRPPASRADTSVGNGGVWHHIRSVAPRNRLPILVMAGISVVATGWTTASASGQPQSTGSMSMGAGMSMPARMSMPPGMDMRGVPSNAGRTSRGKPSQSARMVCADETRHNVALALHLPQDPRGAATWVNQLYTCTYTLPEGTLVLSVKELATVPSAAWYFNRLRAKLAPTDRLVGVASLGLASYETPNGTVVFRKDDKVLRVDAAGLGGLAGLQTSSTEFAYKIATDVLACWNGK